jgi:putative membrane protein
MAQGDAAVADDERNQLAESRTDLAEDRTVLANERTFAGWVRTGLTTVAIGLGFSALFRQIELVWVAKAIATGFLLIGIFIFISSERRACKVLQRLNVHEVRTVHRVNIQLVSWGMVVATLALIAALWAL